FFQAEDGIRDRNVTGVQTCALPICLTLHGQSRTTLDRLITIDGIEFAATCIGRFDAVLTVRGATPMAIDRHLEEVRSDASVYSITTWFHIRSAKVDYARMGIMKSPNL